MVSPPASFGRSFHTPGTGPRWGGHGRRIPTRVSVEYVPWASGEPILKIRPRGGVAGGHPVPHLGAIMKRWKEFRDAVGRLSVRHKPRLEQWQKFLTPVFAGLGGDDVIQRGIEHLFATAETWCADGRVNEPRAEVEFRRATAYIEFLSHQKGGHMEHKHKSETGQARIERATAFVTNPASAGSTMPQEMKERFLSGVRAAVERQERRKRYSEILATM